MMALLVSIIQARMSSQRLPGKVLKPLGDRSVLGQVVKRTAQFSKQVIVCTSVDSSDDPIVDECRKIDVLCVRGSLDNVYSRYRRVLADPDTQVSEFFARVTADCPLVSVGLAQRSLAAADQGIDYVGVHQEKLPRGISVEVIRRSTFEGLASDSLDGPQREHVTLALYEKPGQFKCEWVAPHAEVCAPEFRLTVDYPEDYELLRALFERDSDVTAEQAIEWLRDDPELAGINAHCRQKAVRG